MRERVEEFLDTKAGEIDRIVAEYPKLRSLKLNYEELWEFDLELAEQLVTAPERVIPAFEEALRDMVIAKLRGDVEAHKLHVRFFNLPREEGYAMMIRDLNSDQVGRFVSVEGLVNKMTDVMPKVAVARFVCNRCETPRDVPQEVGLRTMQEPIFCEGCGKRDFRFVPEESKWSDVQKLEIQEPLEILRGGEQARRIEVWLEDDLVDVALPGDKIIVNGILRLVQQRRRPIYTSFLHANYVETIQKEFEELEITEEEEKEIQRLRKDPRIYEKIINSIAPGIYGYKEVKEAMALQLFGGTPGKKLPDGTPLRNNIHILLVGDPGVAKSRILQYVNQIAPKSIYVTGKGVTGAGLTAVAERDEFGEGGWTIKAGALVLASGGIACIDEFDKMNKDDREAMHEALEQQSFAPDFELTLADGRVVEIGEFVDELMEKYRGFVIKGVDCEILPIRDKSVRLLSTDFERIFEAHVDRVSRHKASDYFIEISLRNGRKLKVTPEHPCWVVRDGRITTIPAEDVRKGEFFPVAEEFLRSESCAQGLGSRKLSQDLVPNVGSKILELARVLGLDLGELSCDRWQHVQKEELRRCVDLFLQTIEKLEVATEEFENRSSALLLAEIHKASRVLGKEPSEETLLSWKGRPDLGLLEKHRRILLNAKQDVEVLRKLAYGKIGWCEVTRVRRVRNKNARWVYDVTVEPHHTFISNSLVLHNTISIAKAGIVTRFMADTAVLAASNPKFSRFDPYRPLAEQFDIPPTLLSRFDLIFAIRDVLDLEKDRKIAEHMIKVHRGGKEAEEIKPEIGMDLLRKYVAYARRYVRPRLAEEAAEKLKEFYVELRDAKGSDIVRATPRQLEALIRLAEASAKLRLSDKVTIADAERAIRLMKFVLKEIAYDETTGQIDIDRWVAKYPKSVREKMRIVEDIIRELITKSSDRTADYEEVVKLAEEKGVERLRVDQLINELKSKGVIYEPKHGKFSFAEG